EMGMEGSYNRILGREGRPIKVIKYETDITANRLKNADYEGQLAAISKSQAVIEFELDGTVTSANENFLSVLGYRLQEIQGQHHKIGRASWRARGAEYGDFGALIRHSEYQGDQNKRVRRRAREEGIQ